MRKDSLSKVELNNYRRSLNYFVNKHQIKKERTKVFTDFNSQIIMSPLNQNFGFLIQNLRQTSHSASHSATATTGNTASMNFNSHHDERNCLKINKIFNTNRTNILKSRNHHRRTRRIETEIESNSLNRIKERTTTEPVFNLPERFGRYQQSEDLPHLKINRSLNYKCIMTNMKDLLQQSTVPPLNNKIQPWQTKHDFFHDTLKFKVQLEKEKRRRRFRITEDSTVERLN